MSQTDYRVLPLDNISVQAGNGARAKAVGVIVDRVFGEGFKLWAVIVAEPGKPLVVDNVNYWKTEYSNDAPKPPIDDFDPRKKGY